LVAILCSLTGGLMGLKEVIDPSRSMIALDSDCRLNLFHSVTHFFGGVLTAWYLADLWGYNSMWYVSNV
jgi:hypothetical protein